MGKPDLIVAPATARGRGAIGIVRLSGYGVERLVSSLTRRSLSPRQATLCSFLSEDGSSIDQGLAIFFPEPNSYTGEAMVELQGHGGPVVQNLLVRRCVQLGARLAEAGEFTKRAYLNDRIDLAQAEAVADLIDAQTELAARGAMRSLKGEFSNAVNQLQSQLLDLRALVESSMDFPEEGLELVPESALEKQLTHAVQTLTKIRAAARRGSRLREGAKLVIVGSPNVGKSSLLNKLAEEDVAIVSDIPGTTRDLLRESIVIDGLPFEVVDTAGVRESRDVLERMGIERTLRVVQEADVALFVTDLVTGPPDIKGLPDCPAIIRVVNKIDLRLERAQVEIAENGVTVYLSAKTGEGIDLLRSELVRAVGWAGGEEGTYLARERHLDALEIAGVSLGRASSQLHAREIFAEELRQAQVALSRITGAHTADDLLGTIFSRFCIGK